MAAATAAVVAAIAAGYVPPAPLPVLPALPARTTRTMIGLSALVPARVPVLRSGRTLNITRPANMEALLGQYTGQVNAAACTHCAGGAGSWTECVSVPGFFGGSCASCHYGSEGSRCSLRTYLRSVNNPLLTIAGAAVPAAAVAVPAGPSWTPINTPSRRVAPVRRTTNQVAPGSSSSKFTDYM